MNDAMNDTTNDATNDWPISVALRSYLDVQYEMLRVLGAGGMGVVLLARERALERMVAIKVLRPDTAADTESRERFRREARTAARLTHPHIVPLHTFGDVGGELYFVMGYVDGETLATRLTREGRLATDDAIRILAEIADALDYAHRSGTVHRDLKPENILLETATGRALLTDFGIARDIGSAGSLTSTGIIVGTPHYMSPEQASGERAIDGRSDIYALGVIGYRMVSGTLPFGGSNAREVIARQLAAVAAPLPEAVREEAPGFVAAVTRAMLKAPEARWPTAQEMATALRATTDDELLGPESADNDAIVAKITVASSLGAALVPLGSVAGLSGLGIGQSVAVWAAATVTAAVVGAIGARVGTLRGDPATRAIRLRIALRPPTWWFIWWPKKFRRPGDVWERLPFEVRAVHWMNGISTGILLPIQAGAIVWAFAPANSTAMGELLTSETSSLKWYIGVAGALALVGVAALVYLASRLRRRTGLDARQQRWAFSFANADPRWKQARYSVVLGHPSTKSVRQLARSTDDLLREVAAAGVALPDGLADARAAARRATESVDRELLALREMVNAEEIQRLDTRLAALASGDSALRAMLASQRALLERAESRIFELGALRARLDAQQELLHQQLIALRDLAPSGADLSEITGKLRAVNDDLRRLAEGHAAL